MGDFGKILMVIGAVLFAIGLLWPIFGKLPGDILIRKGNATFFFPVVTCLLISIVLSLIFYIINYFR
ncbi:DUF2905 domain-containing protein [Sporolactobacillus sp. THM7-7]|nr:DUF2905 domain-containing protein [Sporolactobacillus sp. THM7-7]